MTSLTEILYIIGLFVLRLGIPIAVTLTIAYFLHRLDARWEKEARLQQDAGRATKEVEQRKSVSIPLPQPAMPVPIPLALDSYGKPCWELKDCDPVEMADCPARQDSSVPCWQARRQEEGRIPVECYHCEIFLATPPSDYPDYPELGQGLSH
jgi:hypothetical protein